MVFFTNYESKKGKQIYQNKNVCATFYWPVLQRQVRIEGIAKKISSGDSDQYFNSRPLKSQISGFLSKQSQKLESKQFLESEIEELYDEVNSQEDKYIARPEYWGGYVIIPQVVNFWQGSHYRTRCYFDTFRYKYENGSWDLSRLYP